MDTFLESVQIEAEMLVSEEGSDVFFATPGRPKSDRIPFWHPSGGTPLASAGVVVQQWGVRRFPQFTHAREGIFTPAIGFLLGPICLQEPGGPPPPPVPPIGKNQAAPPLKMCTSGRRRLLLRRLLLSCSPRFRRPRRLRQSRGGTQGT